MKISSPPWRGLSWAKAGNDNAPTSNAAITAATTLVFMSLSSRAGRAYSASQIVSSCWFRKCEGVIVQPRSLALCGTMRCHCSVYR